MSEPPLYAGAVHGIRVWRVVPDLWGESPLVSAAAQNFAWPPGEPMRGVCVAGHGRRSLPHLAPAPDCTCGIYAHHTRSREGVHQLEHVLASDATRVAGVISAWGRLEVHLDGFRAELAVPSHFLWRSPEQGKVARELAETYGAESVEIPDTKSLRAFTRSLVGIPLVEARRHVTEAIEIELEPDVSAFYGSTNEAVAQSGFRVSDEVGLDPATEKRIPGLGLFAVAGVSFRADALQRPEFSPGRAVELIPEPDNEHDAHAVGVWDAAGEVQVGYVPRSESRRLRTAIDRGQVKSSFVLSQFRGMNTGERSGIRVLTSPTAAVRFGEVTDKVIREYDEAKIQF